MRRSRYLLILTILAGTGLSMSAAVRGDESSGLSPDELAVRAAAREYLAAKRRGDFEKLGKMWTADGDYMDASGQVFKAQELVREQVAVAAPDSESVDAAVPESSLRFIATDIAIEDGTTHCGTSADGSVRSGRFTAVWIKRDGQWLLDSLREATASLPLPNDRLQPLAWLLGEWVGTADDAVILVSSRWCDGGNYILREFIIRGGGHGPISGTQRIGWDPSAGRIKSWTFDSQGGSGEGYWRREGDRWVVESKEVMADGTKSATTAIYAPGDDGRFVWEVTSAKLADADLPPARVEFKRAADDE